MMQSSKWQKATNKNELLILILKSEKEFAALETHWNALYKRALHFGAPFQQAFNQWKLIGRDEHQDLFIVTIWDGTLLIGVAPFYINNFSSNGSVASYYRNGSYLREELGIFLRKTKKYSICDFSSIIVDSSYHNIFAERLMDVIEPAYLDTNQVELTYSARYANAYLNSRP